MPSRVRVKICCIASRREADLAVAAGADLIGLVGIMPSGPGPIPDVAIAEIAAAAPPGVASVLLTAETEPEPLAAHALRCRPSAVQIVDRPKAGAVDALRAALPGVRVIQVIHVEDDRALDQAQAAARGRERPDALLLDSGRPEAETREFGGTGRVHDWTLSRRIVEASPLPVFLAGGLRPDNVAMALRRVRPYGLDLCTGVRSKGKLDAGKLGAFMAAIRAAG
jgi:phosphoribosylanthranilate isomerase